MREIKSFKFNNIEIPFALDGGPSNIMVEVTQMAKAYGKRIAEWRRLPSTQKFLEELMIEMGFSHINELIYSDRSGIEGQRGGGCTWMHQLVLIEFARWLDSKFAIWCNKMIIEVIRQRFMDEMAQLNDEIARLNNSISQQQITINNLQSQSSNWGPKATYYDQVLQNTEYQYTLRDIQQNLGLKVSYKKLAKMLINDNYAYRNSDGRLYLRSPYSGEGYYGSTTELCKDGTYRAVMKWSEGGRRWIHSLAHKWGVD